MVGLIGTRGRVLYNRLTRRLGLSEDAVLLPLGIVVGILTAAAAVGFHELILLLRDGIYRRAGPDFLYGRGAWMLVVVPTLGGLAVGLLGRVVGTGREGHGVVDVMESVARTKGFVRARSALEKIVTSAITIGTGGSAGAEGPIVQIGAAVSSGVARVFRLSRHQMPLLVGCGCAAGISAIFNAPIGGLLFTLEVILLDFSARAITPIVVSAVVANVTMRALVSWLHDAGDGHGAYITVFADPQLDFAADVALIDWPQFGNFVLLGLVCAGAGVALTRGLAVGENVFGRIGRGGSPWIKAMRPAVGGMLLGLLGLVAIFVAGERVGGAADAGGPFGFDDYPMPAFFGDGYAIIERLLDADGGFFTRDPPATTLTLLVGLLAVKILATVLTLASGGSGGVIAPSLFLGAVAGGLVGVTLRETGLFPDLRPETYALIGMAATLAAVVHAPLASLLILLEITGSSAALLPALLAVVVAIGVSRLLRSESIYTQALRQRGVRLGGADPQLLSRMGVEQVALDPAATVSADAPFERVIALMDRWHTRDFAVVDAEGDYAGFLAEEDVNQLLVGREAVPLVVVGELMRNDVPLLETTADLQRAFDLFARHDIAHLPVGLAGSRRVVGMLSRNALMRRYRQALEP